VLSRTVSAGDEHEFEEVLRQLVAEVRRQPGHLAVTVLEPAGAPAIYTIVSNFASQRDADAWLASPIRARLIAEADLYSSGALQTRHVSGLEAWLTSPGTPVLVPPARWRVIVVSALALLPLLEAISYLLAPRLAGLPVWSRSLISVAIVIPVMQYLVMPAVTRATRGFLYPSTRR
jgi:antibiotic biosynthesis monooxygenase (ABM) superfamily enzyme